MNIHDPALHAALPCFWAAHVSRVSGVLENQQKLILSHQRANTGPSPAPSLLACLLIGSEMNLDIILVGQRQSPKEKGSALLQHRRSGSCNTCEEWMPLELAVGRGSVAFSVVRRRHRWDIYMHRSASVGAQNVLQP